MTYILSKYLSSQFWKFQFMVDWPIALDLWQGSTSGQEHMTGKGREGVYGLNIPFKEMPPNYLTSFH
jgi:hypothetical protein